MGDVFVEGQAQQIGTFLNVFAFDCGCEGFLFQLFPDAGWAHAVELFGPDVGDGGDESAQFVNREQGFADGAIEGVMVLVPFGVGKNGLDDLGGV